MKGQWQFNDKRGAILLMHRPRLTRVPDEFFNAALHLPILKGKCVVHQVWNCPGFYMYLSNRCAFSQPFLVRPRGVKTLFYLASEQVTVSLRTGINPSAGPGANPDPPVTHHWSAEGSTGVRQYAYKPDAVYTPLFCLKSIRKPLLRRDESSLGKEA